MRAQLRMLANRSTRACHRQASGLDQDSIMDLDSIDTQAAGPIE